MQGTHPFIGSTPSNAFASSLASSRSLFTPRHVGLALAGAFFITGTTAALNGGAANQPSGDGDVRQNLTLQETPDSPNVPEGTPPNQTVPTTSITSGSASNTSNANVRLNVNGQDIDVPQNGAVQKVVSSQDGTSQSSVSVNSSSSTSSSSLNVNISSDSSSTGNGVSNGSTIISDDGGTTVISNQ